MTKELVAQYFPGTPIEQDELLGLFMKLESWPGVFYAMISEANGKYGIEYASLSMANLTGHKGEDFKGEKGFSFIYTITPPEYRVKILEQEAYYIKKAKQSGFDVTKPFVIEIDGAFQHGRGHLLKARLLGLVLEFTPSLQFRFSVNAWLLMDSLREDEIKMHGEAIEKTLTRIQQLYVSIFEQRFSMFRSTANDSIRLSYPFYGVPDITKQEYRVLKLVADGLSSKEVALELGISLHTAESHRRNLLEKLDAKNVAELIKKATKLYWLE